MLFYLVIIIIITYNNIDNDFHILINKQIINSINFISFHFTSVSQQFCNNFVVKKYYNFERFDICLQPSHIRKLERALTLMSSHIDEIPSLTARLRDTKTNTVSSAVLSFPFLLISVKNKFFQSSFLVQIVLISLYNEK